MKTIYLIRNKKKVGVCKIDIDNKTAYLEGVKIYKKFRGNNYCYYLIKKAINRIKQINLTKIYLHVKHDNIPAIKCYKKNNFKITKRNYHNKKLFGYTMTLNM